MGYAQIIGGGTDGRYTIKLDWGESTKAALLAALGAEQARLQAALAAQQVAVAAADAAEAVVIADLQALIDAYVAGEAALPPEERGKSIGPFRQIYDKRLADLYKLRTKHAPVRIALDAIKAALVVCSKRIEYWHQFVPSETRDAWCVDLTETLAGYTATAEIPGESSLILVLPRGWVSSDGVLAARELMSPEQVFFNAAILPGWQKDKPTYRWGTLSAIDWDAQTATVALAEARSSAQGLGVNRQATLTGVPFSYMNCGVRSFGTSDRVVVGFEGQSWSSPRVIGYLDNPRKCPPKFSETYEIPTQQLKKGLAISPTVNLALFWSGGAQPITYQVAEGSLPAGVSLSPAGVLSGTPSAEGTAAGIVVRGSDVFYAPGVNRRYDDSNAFAIVVAPGYVTPLDLPATSSTTIDINEDAVVVVSTTSKAAAEPPNYPTPGLYIQCVGAPFFMQYPIDLDYDLQINAGAWWAAALPAPDASFWYRATLLSGNAWTGMTPGVWVTSVSMEWRVSQPGGTVNQTLAATWKVEISTNSSGTNIVSTATGSITCTGISA